MTIRFLCPHGHKLAVPDNLAGKKGRCPVCQQRVYIPLLTSADLPSDGLPADPPPAALGAAGREAMPDGTIDAYGHGSPPLSPPELQAAAATGAGAPSSAAAWPDDHPSHGIAPPDVGRAGPPPIPGAAASGDGVPGSGPPAIAAPPGDWPEPPVLPPPAVPPSEAVQELSVIMDEPEGYQADAGKVQTSYMLAMALGALTLLCAAPALQYINLLEAPNWARVVLIASAVQLIFICWMVSLPDWSTVWICMVVFAFVAALYGVGWAVITFTPEHMAVNFLDLDDPTDDRFRRKAGAWCFVILMLAALLTYACGRFSGRWRKQYELAKAMRE